MGATNPVDAAPGTIRKSSASTIRRIGARQSDRPGNGEEGNRPIFKKAEIVGWAHSWGACCAFQVISNYSLCVLHYWSPDWHSKPWQSRHRQDKKDAGAERAVQALEDPPAASRASRFPGRSACRRAPICTGIWVVPSTPRRIFAMRVALRALRGSGREGNRQVPAVIDGEELEPVCEQDDVPATEFPRTRPFITARSIPFRCVASCRRRPSPRTTISSMYSPKFGGTDPRHTGEWVDEVAARAARSECSISRADGHADLWRWS